MGPPAVTPVAVELVCNVGWQQLRKVCNQLACAPHETAIHSLQQPRPDGCQDDQSTNLTVARPGKAPVELNMKGLGAGAEGPLLSGGVVIDAVEGRGGSIHLLVSSADRCDEVFEVARGGRVEHVQTLCLGELKRSLIVSKGAVGVIAFHEGHRATVFEASKGLIPGETLDLGRDSIRVCRGRPDRGAARVDVRLDAPLRLDESQIDGLGEEWEWLHAYTPDGRPLLSEVTLELEGQRAPSPTTTIFFYSIGG